MMESKMEKSDNGNDNEGNITELVMKHWQGKEH